MDGKGRWIDMVSAERIGKSVKYEHVYLHACEPVAEARRQSAGYSAFSNTHRPHSSRAGRALDMTCFNRPIQPAA